MIKFQERQKVVMKELSVNKVLLFLDLRLYFHPLWFILSFFKSRGTIDMKNNQKV